MSHKHNAPYETAYSCGKKAYTPELSVDDAPRDAAKMAYHLVAGARIPAGTKTRYFRELVVAYLAGVADAKGGIDGLFEGSARSPFDEGEHSDSQLPEHGTYYIQKQGDEARVYLVQPYKSLRWTLRVYQMSKYKSVANALATVNRQRAMVEAQ